MNSRAVIYYISQREMQGSVCDALLYGVCRPAPPGARGSGVQRCTDGGRDGGRGATAHCDCRRASATVTGTGPETRAVSATVSASRDGRV